MKTNNELKTVFGSLWDIYSDAQTYEVLIDAFDDVYYSHKDGIKSANKIFKNAQALNQFVTRLQKLGNNSSTFKLSDEAWVNIVLPPIALRGPSVVITKIPKQNLTLDDLVKFKALNAEAKKIIEKIVKGDKGFLVAGNMGSGKTTLMNILINLIPQPMRVVTLERFPEFVLKREKLCRLQAPNHKVSEMLELVGIAERMRADFLVISDLLGAEVMPYLDVIRSSCTGAALLKGENVLDALKTLENKAALSSEGLSLEDVRYVIAQAFKHIIFQERKEDGSRVISSIAEIQYDSGKLKLKFIYKYK